MAEILMPTGKPCNLKDYQETYDNFSWDEVASQFSWSKTGKINMAYEAIDKHVEEGHGNDIALHFINDNTTETYTYRNLMKNSNKIANVLVDDAHVKRGDRVFIFMPRSPESACAMLGIMKIGALACPIFEAFMERA
ncbi:MAG: AMP-binding protein, partial [Oscillospiraceae bacterium]